MAGRFVYNAAGQKVWVEDGAAELGGGSQDMGGIQMGGGTGTGPNGRVNEGGLANYYNNLEAARLTHAAAGTPYNINAAQAGPVSIDRSREMATRSQQMALLDALNTNAAGGGPSAAAGVTLAGQDAATRAMMASKGLRAGMAGGSGMLGQNAMSGAAMKSGEQQGAWGALTNAAYGVRGADIAGATEEAKLQQQIALANAGFKNQATIANQNAALAAMGNKSAAAGMYAGLVGENRDAKSQSWGQDLQEGRDFRARNLAHQDLSDQKTASYLNTMAKVAAASDERVKTDVKPDESKLRDMLDNLAAYEYRYKDTSREGTSPGKHVSVMAQDLEKSELGGKAVFDSEEGHKMVDYGKLAPTMLAGLAMINKRLNKLEKR